MIILGTNSIKDTGFNVANSCRFNRADGPNMTKTPGSSGDLRKWTWSCWVKRGSISNGSQTMFNAGSSSNTQIRFDSDDTINFYQYNSGYTARLATNQKFKDPTAWLHIVAHWDTDNGTAGDRMKLFVNGSEVTSFATDTNPNQNLDSYFGASGTALYVGDKGDGAEEMDGYLAEVCFIDGQNLAPSSFGQFDSDSPNIWKPIDVSGLTFGTNGFYLDFEDSANLGNDKNGGTDLTENNIAATDQATDTPTNNFATLNPLDPSPNAITFSEGNLKATGTSGDSARSTFGTFALSKGKWWCEIKVTVGTTYPLIGIIDSSSNRKVATYFADSDSGTNQSGFGVLANDDIYHDGSVADTWVTFATDDIIGLGLDMDASPPTLTFKKNNGDEKTIDTEVPNSGFYNFPAIGLYYSAAIVEINFGNPSYSISSGNADANGYGNFEHAPKSGYYSCCTKNLAEFGG